MWLMAIGKVKQITEWHPNIVPDKTEKYANAFEKKYKIDFYYLRVNTMMKTTMLMVDQGCQID